MRQNIIHISTFAIKQHKNPNITCLIVVIVVIIVIAITIIVAIVVAITTVAAITIVIVLPEYPR